MITKSKFKKIDAKGVRPFSVVKDLTLEVLTENPRIDGTTKTFIQYGEGKGFMVRNESNDGFWLVPYNVTKPAFANVDGNTDPVDEIANNIVEDVKKDIQYINDNPTKKILGFTYKQIAIIAVLLIIARKL